MSQFSFNFEFTGKTFPFLKLNWLMVQLNQKNDKQFSLYLSLAQVQAGQLLFNLLFMNSILKIILHIVYSCEVALSYLRNSELGNWTALCVYYPHNWTTWQMIATMENWRSIEFIENIHSFSKLTLWER